MTGLARLGIGRGDLFRHAKTSDDPRATGDSAEDRQNSPSTTPSPHVWPFIPPPLWPLLAHEALFFCCFLWPSSLTSLSSISLLRTRCLAAALDPGPRLPESDYCVSLPRRRSARRQRRSRACSASTTSAVKPGRHRERTPSLPSTATTRASPANPTRLAPALDGRTARACAGEEVSTPSLRPRSPPGTHRDHVDPIYRSLPATAEPASLSSVSATITQSSITESNGSEWASRNTILYILERGLGFRRAAPREHP
jgi:hypothetical protein